MNVVTTPHPKALPYLFLTELWERFGFYLTQGLLVLYMSEYYGLTDDESYTISGVFGGLVYISPFFGGLIADRILGFKNSIAWGGLLLIFGYFFLSISSTKPFFYLALAIIIVGNGLLKPNISSLLGSQYAENDPKRDAGFTIFYIGINIGVALSGISGYVKNAFGWHHTFILSSVGMIIGLITFFIGNKHIKESIRHVPSKVKYQLIFYCLLAIFGISFLFRVQSFTNLILPGIGVLLLIFLVVLTLQQSGDSQKRMMVLNTLIVSSIVFWMLFFQMFNSANLYIERLVDKNLFGLELTTTVFYASEGVFIILFGPFFAWLWHTLAHYQKNPSAISKFIAGLFFTGLGFLVLSVSTLFPTDAGLVNPLWIFLAYLMITFGELSLSPIGLSAVTILAPTNLLGMMMGIWFVATGFGGFFAGLIAKISSIPDVAYPTAKKLAIYHEAFLHYAYIAFFVCIILLFVRVWIKKVTRALDYT